MESNSKHSDLINLPAELRQIIFKELSIVDAQSVRLVSRQCQRDVDTFQVSILEIDDRKSKEIGKQFAMRSKNCKIIHLTQRKISSAIFKYPEYIENLWIEDISEIQMGNVLKQLSKSCTVLKSFSIRLPSTVPDDKAESLVESSIKYYWEYFVEIHKRRNVCVKDVHVYKNFVQFICSMWLTGSGCWDIFIDRVAEFKVETCLSELKVDVVKRSISGFGGDVIKTKHHYLKMSLVLRDIPGFQTCLSRRTRSCIHLGQGYD